MDVTIKYCVGQNFRPEPFKGQKQPIYIGSKEEVKKWIDGFFKSIYGGKK
jgi:hypothetical protein